jgi:ferredoxin
MRYVPVIDGGGCILSGDCEELCPSLFKVNAREAEVLGTGADEATREALLEAAQACPTEAITVTDTQTGEQLWP